MSKIKVKPAEGLIVKHPESGAIINKEREIERTPAVIRMLKDGDLVEVKQNKVSKKATKKQEAE